MLSTADFHCKWWQIPPEATAKPPLITASCSRKPLCSSENKAFHLTHSYSAQEKISTQKQQPKGRNGVKILHVTYACMKQEPSTPALQCRGQGKSEETASGPSPPAKAKVITRSETPKLAWGRKATAISRAWCSRRRTTASAAVLALLLGCCEWQPSFS